MRLKLCDTIPEHLNLGDIVRTAAITSHLGDPKPDSVKVTYRAVKGFHFVVLVLGTVESNKELDYDAAIEQCGFIRKQPQGVSVRSTQHDQNARKPHRKSSRPRA